MCPVRKVHRPIGAAFALGVVSLLLALPSAGLAASPNQLLDDALADAEARGSVHQTLTERIGSERFGYVVDAGKLNGRQVITISGGTRADVLVAGHDAFITGNRKAFGSYFKFPAAFARTATGHWVGIPSSIAAAYKEVAAAVTLESAVDQILPTGRLTARQGTLDGDKVTEIKGQFGNRAGMVTLDLSDTRTPLPVYAKFTAIADGHTGSGTVRFSDWGERVKVRTPAHSLPITRSTPAISGAPGYNAIFGPHGYPLAVGHPWGRPCRPILFKATPEVPDWAYSQIAKVVEQARAAGIDVTLENRSGEWNPNALYYRDSQSDKTVALINVYATAAKPPHLSSGGPEHIGLDYYAALDADGTSSEHLTSGSGELRLRVLGGHPELVRRSIRQLIAMTQGVMTPTQGVSGMSDETTADRFTAADVSAMLKMSGCGKPNGKGNGAGNGDGLAA